MQGRNRDSDIENGHVGTGQGMEDGANWENTPTTPNPCHTHTFRVHSLTATVVGLKKVCALIQAGQIQATLKFLGEF